MRKLYSFLFNLITSAALAATSGWIGFVDSPRGSIIISDGSRPGYPGGNILADGRRIAVYAGFANAGFEHDPANLVYQLSSDGTPGSWGAQHAIQTPSAGNWSAGAGVGVFSNTILVNSWIYDNAFVVDTVYVIKGTVSGTTGGTFGDGITWDAPVLVPFPSGWGQFFVGASTIFRLANGKYALPFYGEQTGECCGHYSSGLLFSTDGVNSWGGMIVTGQYTPNNHFSESAFLLVPAGQVNAGRVIGLIRNDDPDSINSGYWRVQSDNPEVSFTTPTQVLSEVVSAAGRPTLAWLSQGTQGAIVFAGRWEPSTLGITNSYTGVSVSFDQALTFLEMRKWEPGATLIQNWYIQCFAVAAAVAGCVSAFAFNNASNSGWLKYQEFKVIAP